jgi:hypothetical protein
MRALWIVIVIVIVVGFARSTSIAHAGEHDATFAEYHDVKPTQVHDVVGYALPTGGHFTHVLVGRFDHGAYVMAGAVILRCEANQCQGRRADFGSADSIELTDVIDLEGAPGPISSVRHFPTSERYTKMLRRKLKWPVLVVRTTERKPATGETRSRRKVSGHETRTRLYMVSLAADDRASVVLQDTADERYPSGRGATRSYRLERGDSKTSLDVIATEQRHLARDSRCLRPEPTEQRFKLDGRHYKQVDYAHSTGC